MVDWELACRLGARIAGDGPEVTAQEASDVVAELRAHARRSTGLVAEHTGLEAPAGTAPVLVVDRPGWVRANAEGFAGLIGPVAEALARKQTKPPGAWSTAVSAKVAGTELGGMLGFLSSKVLGQFDPFFEPHGRLLLVAPNVVHVEREMDVDPTDFRLWVCLHEETHRVQFTAVPWLRQHLFGEIEHLVGTFDTHSLLDEGLRRVGQAVRSREGSLLDAVSNEEQKAIIDRVTGVMSLLEGHADVVMDGVGPGVIPTVREIRTKFNKRRKGAGSLDRMLRRLLGLDAKMAQYRDGARFVRRVVHKVGMDEFNAVWAEPAHLPSTAEIADPQAWIARVL